MKEKMPYVVTRGAERGFFFFYASCEGPGFGIYRLLSTLIACVIRLRSVAKNSTKIMSIHVLDNLSADLKLALEGLGQLQNPQRNPAPHTEESLPLSWSDYHYFTRCIRRLVILLGLVDILILSVV